MNFSEWFRRRRVGDNGFSCRRTLFALLVALSAWYGVFTQPWALADDPSAEEAIDFYQYTDADGGVHFVDSLEKIPHRYRGQARVRKETQAARQTTRVRIVDGQIFVPVSIRSGERQVQALLLLDTGASMTSITEELAARLQIGPAESRPATTRLADGRMLDIRVAKIDAVAVGARQKSPVEIGIFPHFGSREIHDGLLGFDFLSEFQYQIDIPNQLLRWQ